MSQLQETNVAELGRFMFKNSLQHVVHFTGTGRFLDNDSGRDLVEILRCMRNGKALPEALWGKLQARELDMQVLETDAALRERLFKCHWGGFSWEQVSRLQHLRAAHEAEATGQTLYYVQAVDRSTDGPELTSQQTAASLKVASMSTTGYLMGMVPLFLGMEVRISAILRTPLLCRELPCVVKRIDLHPKEPPLRHSMKAHILQYMPLGVVVEVTDPEYAQFCVPDSDLPPGHFFIEPLTSSAWKFRYGDERLGICRRQVSWFA